LRLKINQAKKKKKQLKSIKVKIIHSVSTAEKQNKTYDEFVISL